MNTAAGIAVGRLFGADHRMMGMAGDKKMSVILRPFDKALFGFLFPAVIFCRAGGIGNAELFERPPYITHEKTGQEPEGTVQRIRLMAMRQIDVGLAVYVLQDDAGIERNIGTKGPFLQRMVTKVAVQVLLPESVPLS